MDFKETDPDFLPVAEYVRRAQLERSAYLAHLIGAAIAKLLEGVRSVAGLLESAAANERDRRAVEADPFLKRAVTRY